MYDKNISVKLEIKNQKVREEIEEILISLKGFQISHKPLLPPDNESRNLLLQKLVKKSPMTQENGYCDLLISEIGEDNPKEELHMVSTLHTYGIVREVFLTSSITSQEILIEILKIGAGGFSHNPLTGMR